MRSSGALCKQRASRMHATWLTLDRVRTLHLRNVPDDVMDRLERMARAASTSVTAVAIRELDAATRRVDNAALIATLPDLDLPTETFVEQLDSERR
ncbi:Putative antitoxin VapB9 (modular protein) [uncultured Mycobacterium sp.]|uniref:Putative antitoxin VapB9 (Modular protein) n=1 Tax=uncultured Mycobacterium sp. TaxID=171292 RepID=A0A1Y5PJH5_9MYCO|nr:Putative antitoxin VapB9 (modular protein) [uncultured Mycobacterium sp.]SBS76464.1 Putative antitoxin VapB9 (modular protein) [uncultured Mycobacterium sp.]